MIRSLLIALPALLFAAPALGDEAPGSARVEASDGAVAINAGDDADISVALQDCEGSLLCIQGAVGRVYSEEEHGRLLREAISRIEREKRQLENEFNQLKGSTAVSTQFIAYLQNQIETKEAELSQARHDQDNLRDSYERRIANLSARIAQLEALRQDGGISPDLEARITQAEAQMAEGRNDLADEILAGLQEDDETRHFYEVQALIAHNRAEIALQRYDFSSALEQFERGAGDARNAGNSDLQQELLVQAIAAAFRTGDVHKGERLAHDLQDSLDLGASASPESQSRRALARVYLELAYLHQGKKLPEDISLPLPEETRLALKALDLSGVSFIHDLSPLAGMQNLQTLHLNGTGVTDLSPLAGMQNLQTLHLWSTGVTDLSPLAGMQNLQTLHLWHTGVTDLSPLAEMQSLQKLSLWDTGVTDLSPLTGIPNLYIIGD